jgi:endonuclease/exonuclease/phosphatase family metal-dependent hydrolase
MRHNFYSFFVGSLLISFSLSISAQAGYDTIKVMSYNVLNYGFPATTNCPALITANKHAWLRTVLQYADPDILGLEKMDASPASFSSDTIIADVLDSVCSGCYGHTPFTNLSGYSKANMLYYKTNKLGWVSTTTIYSADSTISDINLHTLFYKSPSLAITHDTIFLRIILVHLASGQDSAAQRGTEMEGAMNWLNTHITATGNYIFMGDFNTQSSSESCFQQMINSSNPNTLFFDVANQLGNWNGSPSDFANYLTQSTRTTDPGDCGATGGLDDWFDHLLTTSPIMQGALAVTYVPNSFKVIGQDGQHVNKSLIANPTNTAVPLAVLNALYYMSEHLPVIMHLAIDTAAQATGISTLPDEVNGIWRYSQLANNELWILPPAATNPGETEPYIARIFDLTGKLLMSATLNSGSKSYILLNNIANGVYMLTIYNSFGKPLTGKFVKMAARQ